ADVVVIGAGIGGLCAAVVLAARGLAVELMEAGAEPGGKAGVVVLEGVEVDTGPSVLTLPDAFAGVFHDAGALLEEEVQLRALSPAFDYRWPDGSRLLIHHHLEQSCASVREQLGPAAEEDLRRFLARAREIWAISRRRFIERPLPTIGEMFSVQALMELFRIAPLRTMRGLIHAEVRDPKLRMVLERYATYNGSDVRVAPAALACIAEVELGLGGYGVQGGIASLVRALVRVGERLGVRYHYDRPIRRIDTSGGRITGVQWEGGSLPCDTIVANADVSRVFGELLPAAPQRPPSMSGWTGVYRARRQARVGHTILFPANYEAEFADIFDRHRSPMEPTVYLCAQEPCHGRVGWAEEEPLFVMANAPAVGEGPEEGEELRERVHERLLQAGLLDSGDRLLWHRRPRELEARFGGRGAIYGASSNNPFAAFLRPANRVTAYRGLYLASGSAHPGGGLPLCAWSGRLAAAAVLEDRGLQRRGA
ncbi:MAG TPA: phytoene desaturase family protein, partial [Myxococcota bacterium]|nr:phytoene desaturase family protein [Myxococcota bacterium]